jgi:hypothetical protein
MHIWQAALKYNVNADREANKRPRDLSNKDGIDDIVYAFFINICISRTGLIDYI